MSTDFQSESHAKREWERWQTRMMTIADCLQRADDGSPLSQWLDGDLSYCISQLGKSLETLLWATSVAVRRYQQTGHELTGELLRLATLPAPDKT